MTLKGQNIHLRALEPEDLDFLYELENNESVWEVSNTQTPYSKWVLKQYLENAHQDIFEAKQLRLMIVLSATNEKVGLIDLFDFDAKNSRAGIGIIISENFRNQGIGKESLQLISNYAFTHLSLYQLFANITTNNEASLLLFSNFGFQKIGIKKDWNKINGTFVDEVLFQLIHKK
ncbi:GNAT family N-acetyltransferase [Flavobacterium terrigena]|uniref:Diamine N-acetyltransferase n=1 Tax=Flavobacterium terrigena TaxID=402734 RepID=A0A1H6S3D2_9FLAO|nr:GNAT family protein [Flavobacterium terrigena]SEI57952.1 diamine N-acetyltransferase [Flavobacterium terrigena]